LIDYSDMITIYPWG